MSRGHKILLTLAALFLLGIVGTGYALYSWLKSAGPGLAEAGAQHMRTGVDFGKKHPPGECLEEALARDAKCEDFLCHVASKLFLKGCLKDKPVDERACSGVPERGEILKSVTWSLGYCENHPHPDKEACARVAREMQEFCHPQ